MAHPIHGVGGALGLIGGGIYGLATAHGSAASSHADVDRAVEFAFSGALAGAVAAHFLKSAYEDFKASRERKERQRRG